MHLLDKVTIHLEHHINFIQDHYICGSIASTIGKKLIVSLLIDEACKVINLIPYSTNEQH